jgi:catechol 2,3-dioxygenase-like lactoylglutathione lyase family enzyme
MIGYVTLGTNDFDRGAAFYDSIMCLLDAKRLWAYERGVAWGTSHEHPSLGLLKPFDGQPASVGNGTMVALKAPSPDVVDQVHLLAIALGGQKASTVAISAIWTATSSASTATSDLHRLGVPASAGVPPVTAAGPHRRVRFGA